MKRKNKTTVKLSKNLLKGLLWIVVFVAVFWFSSEQLIGTSYYYYQPFNSVTEARTQGWTNFATVTNVSDAYLLGRDGIFFATNTPYYYPAFDQNTASIISISNNELWMYGRPNNGEIAYNNLWTGKVCQFLPSESSLGANFNATAKDPIGFLIIRNFANIDSNNEVQGDNAYHKSAINIWLAQHDSSVTNEWDNLANFVYFMEYAQMNWTGGTDTSRLGYFDGSEQFPTTAYGPTNESYGNFATGDWRKLYDDNAGGTLNSFNYGTTANANLQPLAIRITHDGSKVRIYLNPNPYPADGFLDGEPNTFFLFAEISVGWNTDMKVMIGHEALYYLNEDQSAQYDDFIIRSVCNTLTSSIAPKKVLAGSTNKYTITAVPTFSATDSGIGEFVIEKPSYITNSWDLSSVVVSNDYDNNGSLTQLTRLTTGMPANTSQYRVLTNREGFLKIIYFTDTTSLINNSTSNKTNIILFSLATPSTANSTGEDFKIYANLEKYSDRSFAVTNLPTTGRKQADPSGTGEMLVKSFDQPYAFASATSAPTIINEGAPADVQAEITYELSTKDVIDKPSISQAIINIPTGFFVSNIQSLLIQDDSANIAVSNNQIILTYSDDAVGSLPSPNGYDRITFTTYGTPDIPSGLTNTNYLFSSTVSASAFIEGTTHQTNGTNANYPSQHITVAAPDPIVACHIFPNALANAIKTNSMTYTVQNNGATYNYIKFLRIKVPTTVITNILNPTSTKGATVVYNSGTGYINIDYSGVGALSNAQSDSINFDAVHKITNLNEPQQTVNFTSESDNNNGKGYLANTQDSQTWAVTFVPPDPKGMNYIEPGEIWTSIITNTFRVYVYNNGPKGDKLFQVKVAVPSIFTNFDNLTVTSTHLTNSANIIKTNVLGTNFIWLKYFKESTNIVSRNESEVDIDDYDKITFLTAKPITATNTLNFPVYIDNKTNETFATNTSSTNLASQFLTNSQNVTLGYPPVNAEFDVQSRFTNTYESPEVEEFHRIDSSTITNLLVFRIKNTGNEGNYIRNVKLYLPPEISTNIIQSTMSSDIVTISEMLFVNKTGTNDAYILVDYNAAASPTNIPSGITDTVSFKIIDIVNDNRLASFTIFAKNDRHEAQITNVLQGAGNSKNIEFFIPPARGAVGVVPRVFYTTPNGTETNTFVVTVSNWGGGSNNITKTRILLPPIFNSKVIGVSNTFLNYTQTSPEVVTNSTNVILTYTNQLLPGDVDKIYLTVKVDYNLFPLQTVNWGIYVDNEGTTANETILISQGLTNQYATVQPSFTVYETDINDHSIFTTDYTNIVKVRYVNGTNVGSYSNSRFKVTVPQPFIMPSLGNISTGKPATVSINGRDIIVSFSTPLDGANYDIVTMNLSNQFEETETNTVWSAQIDYGDGIWKDANSNSLIDSFYYTNVLSMVLPPASALSYLEPATLFVDVTSQSYAVSLSNSGSAGNHIRLVEIIPPAFIISASNIVSTISGTSNWFANGRVYVKYSTNNRLLISSNDTISFIGYDNATTTSGSAVSWNLKVANTTNTNDLVNSGVAIGKTLSTLVTFPEYRAEYHVTPVNIDSATTSNQFTIYIDNKSPQSGAQDSYIQKVKFDIPQSVFLTNGLVISSAKTEDITLTGYTVVLNYTNSLAPKSNDIITMGLNDYFESGNTNVFWNVMVNFNTIGTNYTNGVVINGTNVASFGMPKPQVKAWFVQQEIYTSSTNARLVYVLSNFGLGSNKVEKVTIRVPEPLNSGCTNQISTRASSVSYDGTNIILIYTNFSPELIDTISFDITNSISTISNLVFETIASNSSYSSNVYVPAGENTLKIVNAPSAKIDPLQTDTTKATNTIVVYLLNNGSGSSSLRRAKVVVPDIYTSIISATSSKVGLSAISNSGNTYFIDYSSAPVINGDFDSVTFTLVDGFTHGITNKNWVCYIDNGNGFATSVPESVGALSNSFVMPSVVGTGWMNSTWVYASENQSVYVTNTITLSITNEGSGSNNIYRSLIIIPQLLTNISSISSSKSAVIEVNNSTNLYLYYTNDLLKPGENDTVSFTLVQNLNNAVSYEYGFYIDNDDGNGLIKVGTPASDPNAQQRLDILVKDEDSEFYISGAKAVYIPTIVTNRTIFTMDDAAVINIALRNKSKQFSIDSFTLNLTNLYTITSVTNTISGSGLTYSVSNSTVTFTYTGNKLPKLLYDTISIFVNYDKNAIKTLVDSTGAITNKISGMIKYEGSSEYVVTSGLSKDELIIDNATFGRFYGQVLPKSIGASVTLKYLGTETLATNTDGSYFNSLVDSSTGIYVLDKIPVGQYDIVVMPPTLEQYQTNGKTIDPVQYNTAVIRTNESQINIVNNITNITMVYKSLDTQSQNEQQVLCPDDPLTKLIVPPNTLINGISVNIEIETMTADQASDTENNSLVKSPSSSSILPAYHFIITDLSDNTILEEGFKGDVEVVLHYDISNIQAQGWTTNDLAIYYWKPSTKKWVMIGGVVDSTDETIRIKAGYLHTYYAVMQKNITDVKTIHNVKASPNPFTPGRGDGQYSNMKLTFMFDKPYDSYQVKIFNIKGQVIRSFTRDGTYAQGEVFWDGKDKNGFFIPGGVYLYQIKAGEKVYTGSVLLLR